MAKAKKEEEAEGAGQDCLGVKEKKKRSARVSSEQDLDQTFHTLRGGEVECGYSSLDIWKNRRPPLPSYQHNHLQAVGPWANPFPSLGLSFPTCSWGGGSVADPVVSTVLSSS